MYHYIQSQHINYEFTNMYCLHYLTCGTYGSSHYIDNQCACQLLLTDKINLLDKAKGTHHFEVDENQAKFIYKQIQSKLPGYLVPRLVQDIMGKKSKTLAI